jgi:hypothetical protein
VKTDSQRLARKSAIMCDEVCAIVRWSYLCVKLLWNDKTSGGVCELSEV